MEWQGDAANHNISGEEEEDGDMLSPIDDFSSVDFSTTEFDFKDPQPTLKAATDFLDETSFHKTPEGAAVLPNPYPAVGDQSSSTAEARLVDLPGISSNDENKLVSKSKGGIVRHVESPGTGKDAKDKKESLDDIASIGSSHADVDQSTLCDGNQDKEDAAATFIDTLTDALIDSRGITTATAAAAAPAPSPGKESVGGNVTKMLTECFGDGTTCAECGKTFSHSFYFGTHIVCHMGEKSYQPVGQCGMCGLVFADAGVHQAHMMSMQARLQQMPDNKCEQQEDLANRNSFQTQDEYDLGIQQEYRQLKLNQQKEEEQLQLQQKYLFPQSLDNLQRQSRKRKKEKDKGDVVGGDGSVLAKKGRQTKKQQQPQNQSSYDSKTKSAALLKASINIPLPDVKVVLEKLDDTDLTNLPKQHQPKAMPKPNEDVSAKVTQSNVASTSQTPSSSSSEVAATPSSSDCPPLSSTQTNITEHSAEKGELPKKRARKAPVKFEAVIEPKTKRPRKQRPSSNFTSSSSTPMMVMRQPSWDESSSPVDEDPEVERYLQSLRDMGLTVDSGDNSNNINSSRGYKTNTNSAAMGNENDMFNYYKQLVHNRDKMIGSVYTSLSSSPPTLPRFSDLVPDESIIVKNKANNNNVNKKHKLANHHHQHHQQQSYGVGRDFNSFPQYKSNSGHSNNNSHYFNLNNQAYHRSGPNYSHQRRLMREEDDLMTLMGTEPEIMPKSGKQTRGERLKQRQERLSQNGGEVAERNPKEESKKMEADQQRARKVGGYSLDGRRTGMYMGGNLMEPASPVSAEDYQDYLSRYSGSGIVVGCREKVSDRIKSGGIGPRHDSKLSHNISKGQRRSWSPAAAAGVKIKNVPVTVQNADDDDDDDIQIINVEGNPFSSSSFSSSKSSSSSSKTSSSVSLVLKQQQQQRLSSAHSKSKPSLSLSSSPSSSSPSTLSASLTSDSSHSQRPSLEKKLHSGSKVVNISGDAKTLRENSRKDVENMLASPELLLFKDLGIKSSNKISIVKKSVKKFKSKVRDNSSGSKSSRSSDVVSVIDCDRSGSKSEKVYDGSRTSGEVVVPILSSLKYCGDVVADGTDEKEELVEGVSKSYKAVCDDNSGVKERQEGEGEKGEEEEEGDNRCDDDDDDDEVIQDGEDIEGWTVSISALSDSEEEDGETEGKGEVEETKPPDEGEKDNGGAKEDGLENENEAKDIVVDGIEKEIETRRDENEEGEAKDRLVEGEKEAKDIEAEKDETEESKGEYIEIRDTEKEKRETNTYDEEKELKDGEREERDEIAIEKGDETKDGERQEEEVEHSLEEENKPSDIVGSEKEGKSVVEEERGSGDGEREEKETNESERETKGFGGEEMETKTSSGGEEMETKTSSGGEEMETKTSSGGEEMVEQMNDEEEVENKQEEKGGEKIEEGSENLADGEAEIKEKEKSEGEEDVVKKKEGCEEIDVGGGQGEKVEVEATDNGKEEEEEEKSKEEKEDEVEVEATDNEKEEEEEKSKEEKEEEEMNNEEKEKSEEIRPDQRGGVEIEMETTRCTDEEEEVEEENMEKNESFGGSEEDEEAEFRGLQKDLDKRQEVLREFEKIDTGVERKNEGSESGEKMESEGVGKARDCGKEEEEEEEEECEEKEGGGNVEDAVGNDDEEEDKEKMEEKGEDEERACGVLDDKEGREEMVERGGER